MVNFKSKKATGIDTIDKCIMGTIWHYRNKGQAIDTIYLNTYHWSVFLKWVEDHGADINEIESFDFDGVKIKMQFLKSKREMDIKFYTRDANKLGEIDDMDISSIKVPTETKPKTYDEMFGSKGFRDTNNNI